MAESTNPTSGADDAAAKEARIAELEAEVAQLREQAVAAAVVPEVPATAAGPSFTFNEAMRLDLESTGRTVSPQGKRYVGTGVNDAREATLAEFTAAKPPTRAKAGGAGGSSSAAGASARGGRGGRGK